jgi:hypothetical protein
MATIHTRLVAIQAFEVGLLGEGVLLVRGLDLSSGDALGRLLQGKNASALKDLSIGIQSHHNTEVFEGVLLLAVVDAGAVGLGRTKFALNFIGVDDTSQVRIGHDVLGHFVASLVSRFAVSRAEDLITMFEGIGSPDDESSEVTTGSQLQKVETVDASQINTGQVAECTSQTIV